MRFNNITQRNIAPAKKQLKILRSTSKRQNNNLCQGRTLIKECLIDSVQQNLLSTESMEFKNGLL